MIYFKNETTQILDNQFGDLSARITDIENAIFREISKQILEYEKDILIADEFIANLDCYLHFFIMAEKLGLSRPLINSENEINENILISENKKFFHFEDGRNLITELMSDRRYIKNSFDCKGKNIFILTGNISSGKSVFLRQIGILIYLSQIGSYIPAKNLEMNIFNKILTNIEIFESSLDHLSGFTIELKEIKIILDQLKNYDDNSINSINENTLILIDDPYKRTSIHNKNCLLVGTIYYLNKLIIENKIKAKIFITTSNETKNFLIEKNVIDYSCTSLYEMKTEQVNRRNEDETNFMNLYEIREVSNIRVDREILNDNNCNMNLILAKENGLDNSIFLNAMKISNLLQSQRKMIPDLNRVAKIVENFKINKETIKINSENVTEEMIERINLLMNVNSS